MVYHEYTHGLSNRLVVDANGNSTLGNVQAGSMGEAWSDWYAMDYLVNQGQLVDTNASGELRVGDYVGAGKDLIRTQPLDCAVGSTSAKCPGLPGKTGGYTYGDFGVIAGGPEVHADGEIWGETLWDLRTRIGSSAAESLITRAMELSPANPSYLDMRNSILQADAVQGGKRNAAIWSVFANRGMGYFASALNGDDSTPFEDFSLPPAPGSPKGAITGKVSDDASKAALAGAVVSIGGHASSPGFSEYLAATTDAAGAYRIPGVFYGTYHDVSAIRSGYDSAVETLTVRGPGTTKDFALRRDWAASSGGASVAGFNGPDYTPFGCGPASAIDQSLGNGWGSTSADHAGGPSDFTVTPEVRRREAAEPGQRQRDRGRPRQHLRRRGELLDQGLPGRDDDGDQPHRRHLEARRLRQLHRHRPPPAQLADARHRHRLGGHLRPVHHGQPAGARRLRDHVCRRRLHRLRLHGHERAGGLRLERSVTPVAG